MEHGVREVETAGAGQVMLRDSGLQGGWKAERRREEWASDLAQDQ